MSKGVKIWHVNNDGHVRPDHAQEYETVEKTNLHSMVDTGRVPYMLLAIIGQYINNDGHGSPEHVKEPDGG